MSEQFTSKELKKLTKAHLIHLIDQNILSKTVFLDGLKSQTEKSWTCHDCRSIAVKLGLV